MMKAKSARRTITSLHTRGNFHVSILEMQWARFQRSPINNTYADDARYFQLVLAYNIVIVVFVDR